MSNANLGESQDPEAENTDQVFVETEDTIQDFLSGVALGLLFGIIMLLLSLDHAVTFSRRWRLGIVFGEQEHFIKHVKTEQKAR